jgi:Flp pilus assembly protein TadG
MKNEIAAGTAPRRRRSSRGSVMVETSLVFIVFAAMLIGIFDFGQFLFVHQALVERARYAARWGAINNPTDSTSIVNMILYNQSSAAPSGAPTYFNLTSSNISVTNPGSGTNDYRVTVQISGYSYIMLSPYIAGTHTGIPITVSVPLGIFD